MKEIFVQQPSAFLSEGQFYQDFSDRSDEEVADFITEKKRSLKHY